MPAPRIPADISPEEWAAIPEIAMPDAEHVVPGFVPPASRPPSPATVCIQPDAGVACGRAARARSAEPPPGIVIVGTATSMAIRPTLVPDASGAPGPRISVSTDQPRNRETATTAIKAEAAMERAGDNNLD
jgi:hypothetical protein